MGHWRNGGGSGKACLEVKVRERFYPLSKLVEDHHRTFHTDWEITSIEISVAVTSCLKFILVWVRLKSSIVCTRV